MSSRASGVSYIFPKTCTNFFHLAKLFQTIIKIANGQRINVNAWNNELPSDCLPICLLRLKSVNFLCEAELHPDFSAFVISREQDERTESKLPRDTRTATPNGAIGSFPRFHVAHTLHRSRVEVGKFLSVPKVARGSILQTEISLLSLRWRAF